MERTVDPQEQAEEVVQDAFAALLPAFVRIDNPDPDLERSTVAGRPGHCRVSLIDEGE